MTIASPDRAAQVLDFTTPRGAAFLSRLRTMPGLHVVTVKKYRKKRSNPQNAYMWAAVYPAIAAGLKEAWGETMDLDEVHDFCKRKFLGRTIVDRTTGEAKGRIIGSSAKLTTEQFAEYLEKCIRFAAESLSVVVPDASEY